MSQIRSYTEYLIAADNIQALLLHSNSIIKCLSLLTGLQYCLMII